MLLFFKKNFFLFAFLLPLIGSAQIIRINPEDGLLADELSEKFPEDRHVSLKTSETYTFPFRLKEQTLNAKMTFKETILSLNEAHGYFKYDFENDKTTVSNLKATNYKGKTIMTYGRLIKAKYKSAGIFHDNIKTANIFLNLSTRGDKINYTYDKVFSDVKYLTKAFFHSSYRCQEKSISFVIPSWLEIEFVEMNFDGYNIEKTESTKKVRRQDLQVITYTLKDIKGVKKERFSSGYNSLPHVIILAKKYTYNKNLHELFSNTGDLYNWYKTLIDSVKNDNSDYQSLIESLTKDASSDKEKIENIYYWVQDNIRYIAYEDGIMGFMPATDKDVYAKKYGDCKGMANLTCEMLKVAGYDARLTWIGTRKIPYTYEIPSLAVDNHMITTLLIDGQRYFLDATETGVSYKDNAYRIQGQDVLIEDGESYIIDTVPDYKSTHNIESLQLELKLSEDLLIGKGHEEYKGEEKNKLFRNFKLITVTNREKSVTNYLSNDNKNISITDVKYTGIDNRNNDIDFDYNVEIKNQITTTKNELYINLEKDFDFASTDIKKEEERVTNMSFGSKYHIDKKITLDVPANFKVDYVPDALEINNEEFSISTSFTVTDNRISYNKKIILKNGVVSVKNIEMWNKSIQKLNEIYEDQIVLIKQ
jgi:transglutaminase-like putative cysteine protease